MFDATQGFGQTLTEGKFLDGVQPVFAIRFERALHNKLGQLQNQLMQIVPKVW